MIMLVKANMETRNIGNKRLSNATRDPLPKYFKSKCNQSSFSSQYIPGSQKLGAQTPFSRASMICQHGGLIDQEVVGELSRERAIGERNEEAAID